MRVGSLTCLYIDVVYESCLSDDGIHNYPTTYWIRHKSNIVLVDELHLP